MKGAIIGDIAGSVYEHNNIKTKDFPFFDRVAAFTDDSVMTVAIADALDIVGVDAPDAVIEREFLTQVLRYGRLYPHRGYGGQFRRWLSEQFPKPYYSCGNGSAMRVSPVAYAARSIEECEKLAFLSAKITHDHPDGICGAQAVAGAVYLALHGGTKDDIREYVSRYYRWEFCLDEIRPEYVFDRFAATNAGTVPYAVQAFLESESFEDAIRCAISIGGDSDTLAAITGSIAEAFYGIPDAIWDDAERYLDEHLTFMVSMIYAHRT